MIRKRNKKEIEIMIEDTVFPGMGRGKYEDREVRVKGAYPGQKVRGRYLRNKQGIGHIELLEVLEKTPYEITPPCVHFYKCGGCVSQMLPYDKELEFKEREVLDLFNEKGIEYENYHGIIPSPERYGYRNKMEYTFGDEVKGGELTLGMHRVKKRSSVLTVDECLLVNPDFNIILDYTLDFFKKSGLPYYRVISHEGVLRNLIIREGKNTGDLMVILVTTTQHEVDTESYLNGLLELNLNKTLKSVFHVENDSLQDSVIPEKVIKLHGDDFITEELLDLKFKITPFSFFQTNTEAAERLYSWVKKLSGDTKDKDVFDLYCGTGTIGNIMAGGSKSVIGVEIIEEAAEIAKENSKQNGITNTHFIAGDVKDVIENMENKPDLIILDPPRSGIHPKALEYALRFNAPHIVYVSCNPKTLVEDITKMNDYRIDDFVILENYPNTPHVEAIVSMSKVLTGK